MALVTSIHGFSKVVVVGGGLAGLTTAYRLHTNGIDVELFEARERVGGRVLSVLLDGSVVELGGHSISDGGDAPVFSRLMEQFGLKVDHLWVPLTTAFHDGQQLYTLAEELEKYKNVCRRDRLEEVAKSASNMREVLDALFEKGTPLYQELEVRLSAYEGGLLEDLSPVYIDTLEAIIEGGIAVAHRVNEAKTIDLFSIKGGNSKLPLAMSEALDSRVHLGMPLRSVTKAENGQYVLSFDDGKKVGADIVVFAIPASQYKKINFEGEVIPRNVLDTFASIQYGTLGKLQISTEQSNSIPATYVNESGVLLFDPASRKGTMYLAGNSGRFDEKCFATLWTKNKPFFEEMANTECELVPSLAGQQIFEKYEGAVGYSWAHDAYAEGSYSYIASGQEKLFSEVIDCDGIPMRAAFCPIHDSLYFAGEHTTIYPEIIGTMEAACESGDRIAKHIIQATP